MYHAKSTLNIKPQISILAGHNHYFFVIASSFLFEFFSHRLFRLLLRLPYAILLSVHPSSVICMAVSLVFFD